MNLFRHTQSQPPTKMYNYLLRKKKANKTWRHPQAIWITELVSPYGPAVDIT